MDLANGKTYWNHTFNGYVYPKLEENIECDVLIIGSGSSGAHCAYFLSETNLSVVLVDKRDICCGSTRANTGLLQYCNDKTLTSTIHSFGEEAAVRHYSLCVQALQTLKNQVVPNLSNQSDFISRRSLYFASTENDVPMLEEEFTTLKKYGFPAEYWTRERIQSHFGFSKAASIITDGDAELNPFKHAQSLIHYAHNHGVRVYEHSKIIRKDHSADKNMLYVENGSSITAEYVIYATGYESQEEVLDPNGVIVSSYAIATNPIREIANWYENMMIWETARPYIYARQTIDHRIIIGGLDETTTRVEKRDSMIIHKRDQLLKQLCELFPELEGKVKADYYWGAFFGETHDGLPTIGIYNDYPNSFFLRGFGGNGTVYSIILSQIIRDLILTGSHKDAYLYMKERPTKR
ncbi:NAD(P)/FAD-dependent oxidoreductase [Bacillus massiliigorillae]|uniref:NAD(P)/FAD-dependent oxidoreductase n=1 Tax=Bacillus massiliigorillae TaxID=1243664 RepID=UPI0003A2E6AF|nr:FAD-dependent oxidoreductase [Bacillus massiliigorillae]